MSISPISHMAIFCVYGYVTFLRALLCSLQCSQVLFLLLFLTYIVCQRHLWDVRPFVMPLFFSSLALKFFALLQKWSWISYEGVSPGIYPSIMFQLYSLVSINFLVLLRFKKKFSFISIYLRLLASSIPKYLYILFSPSVLIFSWFGSSIPSLFPAFHY